MDAVEQYVPNLMAKLDAIGSGNVVKEHYKGKVPNIFVTKFRFHLIYYRVEKGKNPLILRVLHEKLDRLRHLEKTISKLHWVKGDNPIDLL